MPVRTYSPKDVFVIFGSTPLGGFADGDFVTVELPETFTSQIGAGGAHTRSLNPDRSAVVTVRLQQTSSSNDVCAAQWQLDKRTGAGQLPLAIKDGLGRSIFFALQAWVEQPPGPNMGKESGVREWRFRCADVETYQGGNT